MSLSSRPTSLQRCAKPAVSFNLLRIGLAQSRDARQAVFRRLQDHRKLCFPDQHFGVFRVIVLCRRHICAFCQVGSSEQAALRRGDVREHIWAHERRGGMKRLVQLRATEGGPEEREAVSLQERRASNTTASTSGEPTSSRMQRQRRERVCGGIDVWVWRCMSYTMGLFHTITDRDSSITSTSHKLASPRRGWVQAPFQTLHMIALLFGWSCAAGQ